MLKLHAVHICVLKHQAVFESFCKQRDGLFIVDLQQGCKCCFDVALHNHYMLFIQADMHDAEAESLLASDKSAPEVLHAVQDIVVLLALKSYVDKERDKSLPPVTNMYRYWQDYIRGSIECDEQRAAKTFVDKLEARQWNSYIAYDDLPSLSYVKLICYRLTK